VMEICEVLFQTTLYVIFLVIQQELQI